MQHWFSSDWHLQHRNILEYDKRDFESIDKHDEYIINNYNSTVRPEDSFYYLGDFCLGNMIKADHYLSRMNGNKFFIKGNHDKRDMVKLYKKYGEYLGQMSDIHIDDKQIILCHYAMRIWERSHHGSLHLYGHSHDKLEREQWGRSMDVGIMTAKRILGDYVPFSYEWIEKTLFNRPIKLVDGHRNR